jgi:hypothetical protein
VAGTEGDTCVPGVPAPSDTTCDGVDDDCNGLVDDGYVSVPTSCGVGACAATGVSTCVAGTEGDTCVAGTPGPDDTSCDGVDNDCNGATDDGYVATPTSCGVGGCAATGTTTCVAGTEGDTCTPGTPGPDDTSCDGVDNDCNGATDDGYVSTPTSCGAGACAATGNTTCVAGTEGDTCTPGAPSAEICNNVDDDCDGTVDDGNPGGGAFCSTGQPGVCDAGTITCQGGNLECVADGSSTPETCNGLDDDCDTQVDEDFPTLGTACSAGIGACEAIGTVVCTGDETGTECDAVAGTPTTEVCNGADDDCNGIVDDGVPGGCVDHFMCYKVRATPGSVRFVPVAGVTLDDQFEQTTGDVKKPRALCAPADKDGEGVFDEATHLESYQVKSTPRHVPQVGLLVTDQFGTLSLNTTKADRLLVPSGKVLGGPAAEPTSSLDHYKCYKVKITAGTPKFVKKTVQVVDQFENRFYDLKKPSRLCTPVDKNGEGINDDVTHLLCYKAKRSPGEANHQRVLGTINTANQFGAEQLDTLKEEEFCVPALKTVP